MLSGRKEGAFTGLGNLKAQEFPLGASDLLCNIMR